MSFRAESSPWANPHLIWSDGEGAGDRDDVGGVERAPALILAWDTDPAHPLATAHALTEILPRVDLRVARTLRQIRDWHRLVAGFIGMA